MEKTLKQRFLHRCTGALTVALAVFVLLTCWVLFAQQQASAVDEISAGTYYVTISIKCDSTKGSACTLYYTDQGGTERAWNVSFTEDDKWHDYTNALSGYPSSLYMMTHGNNFDNGDIHATVKVSSNSDYSGGITVVDDVHFNVARVGGSGVDGHYDITTDNGYVDGNGSYKGRSGRNWPGLGISSVSATNLKKRTYQQDDNGNMINATAWTTSGYTNAVQLDGKTFTQYTMRLVARDKFGVIIGGQPSKAEIYGEVYGTNGSVNTSDVNRSGFETDGTFSTSYLDFYATLMPDAHLSGQNRNKQRVTLTAEFEYENDKKDATYRFDVTDESYTTVFYDRNGDLKKGTASVTGPALTNSGRTSFNTATNSSTGIQYTYYGDTVYAPFDYTGEDTLTSRFTVDDTFHYIWKGWTPLKDENGNNDASVRNINNATRHDGARTGSAAKYAVAKESLILQECFTKVRHTVSQIDRTTWRYKAATCTADALYYKVCGDALCSFKFTEKGQGALGKGVDYLWIKTGSMKHHKWQKAPALDTYKEYYEDGSSVDYTPDEATAFSESCAADGSHGYFYCYNCGKYFNYLKTDDTTDDGQMFNSDGTVMNEDEVIADALIPALGHAYEFKGWTWGTGTDGKPDYTQVTGTIECANGEYCTEPANAKTHTFTYYLNTTPTVSTRTRAVDQTVRIEKIVKNPTCTAKGSETYQLLAGAAVVRITPPDNGATPVDVETSQVKAIVNLPALGHDYRGACVGTGRNSRTGTYTGHQYQCVRYENCKSAGLNTAYDADNNVTATNPGGVVAHNDTTTVKSPATCMVYAVCQDCGLPFGSLAAHDFSADASRIQSADTAYNADFALSDYQGHYYACAYGCGKYGVLSDTSEALVNGTQVHNFDTNNDGAVTAEDGTLIRPASCTVNGQRKYTCKDCGFVHFTSSDADLLATGHDYSGQPVTLTPFKTGDTYNTTMTASVTCKNENCGKYAENGSMNPTQTKSTVTETVPVVASREEPSCTENGLVTRTAAFSETAFNGALLNGGPFAMIQVDTTEVLRATGHNWVNVSVEWSADHSSCIGTAQCANDASHNVTQSAKISYQMVAEPSCTEEGSAIYRASFEDDEQNLLYYDTFSMPKRSFQDIYNQNNMDDPGSIPATGHSWTEPRYRWTGSDLNGYTKVDAYTSCLVCSDDIEEEVDVERTETPATCEEEGSIVWTANFRHADVFETQKKTKILPALRHDYDYANTKYTWTRVSGGYRCTARAICLNDSSHVDTEAVTVQGVTTPPTCTTKGRTVYTANFTNENFLPQTRTDEVPATGHRWDAPHVEWTFDEDRNEYVSATGTIHCLNDTANTHNVMETVTRDDDTITKKTRTNATCDETGLVVYKAKFSAQFGTQSKSQVLPKLSHELGELHTGTNSTCAAPGFKSYRECNNCHRKFVQSGDEWVEATSLILYPSSEHKDVDGTDCPVITVAAKAPTCKEAGTKAVTYCSGCMLIFSIDGKDTYTATEEGVEVQKPLTEKNYHYGTDKTKYELAINPANHTDLQEVEGVEATCETTGVLHHWYCSGCDKYFTDAAGTEEIHRTATVLPLSGHDYDYANATYVWAGDHSTCTATVVCKNNSEHVLTETVNSEKNVVVPVTCEADGRCSFTATFENENFVTQTTEEMVDTATGHAWDYAGEKYKATYDWAADYSTCTATVYCKNDKTHTTTLTGTITSETEIEQDCDVDGKVVYTATFENNVKPSTEIQTLEKTGHIWDYTGETTPVDYIWSPDSTRCTAVVHCTKNPAHTTEVTVVAEFAPIKVGNCVEDGKAMYEASFPYGIAKSQSEPFETPKLGHKTERIPATPATCIEKGVYLHYYCSQCGKYFSDSACTNEIAAREIIQPMIPHTLAHHEARETGCTTTGSLEYWTCSYCGKYFLDEEASLQTSAEAVVIAARGHNWVERAGKAPTCTEAGWEKYNYCPRCKTTDGYTSIPATGHGDYTYDYVNSSTSADGSVRWDIYTCGRGCGSFYANLTVTLRDKNGKGIPGANVTITSNKTGAVFAGGSTDKFGEFTSNAKFGEDTYKITVNYEDDKNTYYAASTITFYTDENHQAHVIEPKIRKADFAVDPDSTGGNTQPSTPSTPSNVCRWCGEVHTGFFGKIVQFFHNILLLFSR